jgi:exodeoxyribonuclease-5
LGRKDRIEIGDRIICLKNQRNRGLFNGMVVTVCGIERECIDVETDDGRFIYGLQPWWEQLGRAGVVDLGRFSKFSLFDYAYAITTHRAQGSEFDSVLVIEEYSRLWDVYRWRYCAATRARNRLAYVTNDCPVVPS